MKLKDLADLKAGIRIKPEHLKTQIADSENPIYYLQASNFFSATPSSAIAEKNLRKLYPNYRNHLLVYGDYLFIVKDNEVKISRYEQTSASSLPADDIFVLSTSHSIITEYLGQKSNLNYVRSEIQNALNRTSDVLLLQAIENIEINVENIKELEQNNVAEELGLRKEISPDQMPFNIIESFEPIINIISRVEHGELKLDPDFQRHAGLWTIEVKSRLIESIIVRQPIPALYFDASNDSQWIIIDGLQRISAIYDFMQDKYALQGLIYLPSELNGKIFSTLPYRYQRNIRERKLFTYQVQKENPKNLIYNIFKNINTSALQLKPQEIRHAVNPGQPADTLKSIANMEWFREFVPISDKQRDRMYDREIVLRFLSFQIENYHNYSPAEMPLFLDEMMYRLYDIPKNRLDQYGADLKQILTNIHIAFNNNPPFSRTLLNDKRNYIHNNILFELLTYAFSKRANLFQVANISEKFISFFKEKTDEYWENEQAYSQAGLIARFQGIERFISQL